jgi:hypothetical protein
MSDNPFEAELKKREEVNPFEAELEKRINSGPSPTKAILAEGIRKLADTALSLPQIAGDTLAAGASVPAFLGGLIPGGEGPVEAARREFSEQQQQFPASALRAIDLPDANQVAAGLMSFPAFVPGGESPGDSFDRHLSDIDVQELRNEANFPLATGAGELVADLLALLLTKRPVSGRIISTERKLLAENPLEFGKAVTAIAAKPGFTQGVKEFFSTPVMKHLYRGTGRSAETGAEATMLEIINGDNPVETAALAAGFQGSSSLILAALKGKNLGAGDVGLRIAAAGAGTASLYQLIKDAVPGGDDSILDSLEFGYEKVLLAVALGLASGAVGAGRLRGKDTVLQRNGPKMMDAISTLHRGTFIGLLAAAKDGTPEQQAQIEQTLDVLTTRPAAFSEDIRGKLFNSMQDGTFVETIYSLSDNKDFQSVLFSEQPPTFKRPSASPKFGKP